MIGQIVLLQEKHLTTELIELYKAFELDHTGENTSLASLKSWFSQDDRGDVYVYRITKGKRGDAASFETITAGVGTLLIESKIIHGECKVGHIEDIIIGENFRHLGLGKSMVNYLVEKARDQGCYKTTLYTNESTKEFYMKCGFQLAGAQMELRF